MLGTSEKQEKTNKIKFQLQNHDKKTEKTFYSEIVHALISSRITSIKATGNIQ